MQIGKASFGGSNFKKTEYFKLGDGEFVCAILPPLGNLANAGKWSVHYSVHFGYKNTAGKMRLFQSSQVKDKNKMIVEPDAALDRINSLKAQFEQAKKDGNAELVARLDKLVGQKGQFNMDSNHHINAITLDGKIGVLKLRHRAKLALDETIKTLIAKGVDPLTRYYKFRRSGRGLDTSFQVTVYQETMTIAGVGDVSKDVPFKLTNEIEARLKSEARELDSLYPKITSQQIAQIVKEGPAGVDAVFAKEGTTGNATTPAATAAAAADEDDVSNYEEPVMQSSPMTTVAQAPVAQETKAALAQASTSAAVAPASLAAMSDDDFLNSLNV
jgi:hypothetical protein